jgi:hypothetical protein
LDGQILGIKLSKTILDHIAIRHPEAAAYTNAMVKTV